MLSFRDWLDEHGRGIPSCAAFASAANSLRYFPDRKPYCSDEDYYEILFCFASTLDEIVEFKKDIRLSMISAWCRYKEHCELARIEYERCLMLDALFDHVRSA